MRGGKCGNCVNRLISYFLMEIPPIVHALCGFAFLFFFCWLPFCVSCVSCSVGGVASGLFDAYTHIHTHTCTHNRVYAGAW